MRRHSLILFTMVLALASAGAWAEPAGGSGVAVSAAPLAVVQLHPTAVVAGPGILLGEIADIAPGPAMAAAEAAAWPELLARLSGLEVARAAPPGEFRALFAGSVRVRLRQFGYSDSEIHLFSTREALQVQTVATLVSQQTMLAAIQSALAGWDVASLVCPALPEQIVLSGATGAYEVRVAGGQATVLAGQLTAPLEIWSEGVLQKRITARCTVSAYADVAVAAARLERNAPLTADVLRWERRDLAKAPGRAVVRGQESELPGKRLLRSLEPGAVITWENVGAMPDAAAGRPVRLLFVTGPVQVSDEGRLMQDGWVGQAVQAANVRTGQTLRGTLIDADTVRVE